MNTRRRVRPMRWLLVACVDLARGAPRPPGAVPPPKAEAPAGSPRIAVRFGRELGDDAARRPAAGDALHREGGRTPIPDRREYQDPADLRHRRRRPGAGAGSRDRREGDWDIPSRASGSCRPASTASRPCCTSTRRSTAPTGTSSSCRWIAARGSTGTGRPATSTARPGRSPSSRPLGARASATIAVDARQGHPADPRPAHDQVHQAREDPERAAHEVLGPADAPRRARPAPRGVRRASRGALPAGDLPRPLPPDLRRLPRGAARPRSQARVQRTVPPPGVQPHRAGAGPPVLQGVDRARLSRAWSSSRSSTPTRITTTPTPSTPRTSAPTATPSPTS